MLKLQRLLLPCWEEFDKLVVSEKGVSPGIRSEVLRRKCFSDDGMILFSDLKNSALDYAVSRKYEWSLDMDADTILVKAPNTFPGTGFGSVPVWLTKEGDDVAQRISSGPQISYQGSSRFLCRRDIMLSYRYDTRIIGYGGEDFDFFETLGKKLGIHASETDARCVHLHHDLSNRPYGSFTFRNRRLERGETDWPK